MEKRWCRLDENGLYVPMSQQAIKCFIDLFKKNRNESAESELELLNMYDQGEITKEECQKMLSSMSFWDYEDAKEMFHSLYGYHPIKVPVYGIRGIHYLDFTEQGEKDAID